jgi:regulator of protease activity HflC (stomatin/prohibitin superfamily)
MNNKPLQQFLIALVVLSLLIGVVMLYSMYSAFRIDVPAMHIAVLTKKTGEDISNADEISPDENYKGLQQKVLIEGRYFYNPYEWEWAVYPMIEIPEGKMGVRIRLSGNDLPYGCFVATKETEKGIVKEVLRPGRYPINAVIRGHERERNDYAEIVELHDPVTIPAGFRGVVTNLAGPMPEDPNTLLVPEGYRGVQEKTLDAGTYYLNPYMYRIHQMDCRSQRFNLAEHRDLGFPSKDGFWVSLDGIVEFRVLPEKAAEVYIVYHEQQDKTTVDEEIIRKVILPNARSFCRLRGSNSSGREFIGGETRTKFQNEFQEVIRTTCKAEGVDIVQALVTRINPPEAIAKPVRDREIAHQQLKQYEQEKLQQEEEAKLATEKALVEQKQRLVEAERDVVKMTTEAKKRQEVALAAANRNKEVAIERLEAAKDKAQATLAKAKAEAAVVGFQNEAEAAGWKRAVTALGGNGQAYATYVLYQKLAPAYHSIMSNTADSPLMEIFRGFTSGADAAKPATPKPESTSTPPAETQ